MIIQPVEEDKSLPVLIPKRIEGEIVSQSQGFHSGPVQRRSGYKLIVWSWLAASIDCLLVFGFTLIFLFSVSFLLNTTSKLSIDLVLRSGLMVLLLVAVFYMIILRSFLGFTIGEWACDLRLGSPLQRQSQYYSLKVMLRTAVIFLTGVMVLPIFSLMTGKDWAGKISGLNVVSPKV